MLRIACVGDNCVDYYDDTLESFPGGNPVNVAVYVRRLGGTSAYLGAVGTDKYGEMIRSSLAERGVDVSRVQVLPGDTALSHVRRVDGERVFGDYSEGVMADFRLSEEDIGFLAGFDMVVTGLWGHAEGFLADIRRRGIPVAFDGAERPLDPAGRIALPHTDVAFFSDDRAEEQALEARLREIAALGPNIVVATRGGQGSMAFDGRRFYRRGIVSCPVVDTMGAGDSFIAGFLMSYLAGKPVPDCMEAGAENAAVTIGYPGAW